MNLKKLPQITASGFLKHSARNWTNSSLSFYLAVSVSRNDTVAWLRVCLLCVYVCVGDAPVANFAEVVDHEYLQSVHCRAQEEAGRETSRSNRGRETDEKSMEERESRRQEVRD